jgi:phosphoglycerate-specific signal transduction histidine kinase
MKKKNKQLNKLVSIDFARRLKNENIYLREEMKEEKDKLKKIIGILNEELEEVKDDNRKLTNEVEYYQQLKEKMHYRI